MLNNLTRKKNIRSFSVSPENITGENGGGGRATEGSASNAARDLGPGWKVNPYIVMAPGEKAVLADIKGQGAIKHFWITTSEVPTRMLILRIYFDGRSNPAVEVPLSDFFACAKQNRNFRNEFRPVTSMPICLNPGKGMNCYFEMPYRTGFRVEIENLNMENCNIYYQLDCEEKEIPEDSLYFHAQFRRINPLPYKETYTILDGIKGWGQYVGTYMYWGTNSNGWWGEGEIKFFIDGDTDYPTICGTGTEDYFCGAYNFEAHGKYYEYSNLYAGMTKVEGGENMYDSQKRFNMYRFHITDPIYFKEKLKVTIQALGWRSGGRYLPLQDDISSVAYWYSDNLDDIYPELPDADGLEIT